MLRIDGAASPDSQSVLVPLQGKYRSVICLQASTASAIALESAEGRQGRTQAITRWRSAFDLKRKSDGTAERVHQATKPTQPVSSPGLITAT